jgi:tRNA uridine 5-carboxymethylaminomethyl modification enzyme
MFTSRAEHRLLLGVDSARERLMATGRDLGLVPERAFHVEHRRWQRRRQARVMLDASPLRPNRATREMVRRMAGVDIKSPTTWAGVLRRHDVAVERVADRLPALAALEPEDRRIVVGTLRYDGYLTRHRREAERLRRLGNLEIPGSLDVSKLAGLSREVVETLLRHRPTTIAEAERLPGVTPAAIAILVARIGRGSSVWGEGEEPR